MKISRRGISGSVRGAACVLAGMIALAGAAEGTTLVNANATVEIDATSDAGVYEWNIGGPGGGMPDYLTKQWWWYRIGDVGPQYSVDTISAPVVNVLSASSVEITYANSDIQLTLAYNLADAALPGSGASDLSGSVQINNLTGSQMDFNLFSYTDINLSPGTDSVTVYDYTDLDDTFGFAVLDLRANQSSGGAGHYSFVAGIPPAFLINTAVEADSAANLLADLTGGNYSLTGNAPWFVGSAGPGNVAYAYQYEFAIAGGGTTSLGFDNQMSVPEPTTAVLTFIGLISVLWIRCGRNR